jgi:hypothetical protein
MTNTIIKTIIILALPLLISSCHKKPKPTDYNSLPEYFECNINGKYFTYNNGDAFMQNPDGLKANSNGLWITIQGSAKSGGQSAAIVELSINKASLNSINQVNIGDINSEGSAYIGTFIDNPNESLNTDSTHIGKITFTKNTNSLIEGTFYFKAVAQSGFVADVTNGKFKIKI